jgi:hypothetical protein
MEAKELRIGNLVYDYFREIIIDVNINVLKSIKNNEKCLYKPIPLTEEWLLKFGFIGKYKSVHTHWNYKGFGIEQKSDEDDFGGSIPIEQVFYYEYRYDIEHVHQLQNLYFALTGEELTLNN